MTKNHFVGLKLVLFLLILFLVPFKNFGQCAGSDTKTDICDILNPTSQSVNLFALLGGTPTPGGTWTDDDFSQGLNTKTGILNAQLIRKSGIYKFTYTVSGVAGCAKNSATVTVAVGGYAGVPGPAVTCTDADTYDLFHVFDGAFLSPQSNGIWFNVTNGTPVFEGIISPKALGVGTYQFTYSFPPVGNCPAPVPSTVSVRVFRAPDAGTPFGLELCETDNLSIYSNLDLNSRLLGEDSNGQWIDDKNTGEIININDHFINVKRIYDTYGPGDYTFTYIITDTPNPICRGAKATVKIRIRKTLEPIATLVVSPDNICESDIPTATYSGKITGAQVLPDGKYIITYGVSGPSSATGNVQVDIDKGNATFPLDSKFFQKAGKFKVAITQIISPVNLTCIKRIGGLSGELTIHPTPDINQAKLKIDPICQNASALVQITGASRLLDGTYNITYLVQNGSDINTQTVPITVVGGTANFTIPSTLTTKVGSTSVVITNIADAPVGCTNTANVSANMLVNPLSTDPINFKAEINNHCLGEPVPVSISGLGTLSTITMSYTISGTNSAPTQTVTLAVTDGKAGFTIPQNLFPNTGSTRITVTNVVNGAATCNATSTSISTDFSVNPVPAAPIAMDQTFCKSDRITVAGLVPNGAQYKWYDSATATTPLADSFVLVAGNYYVREIPVSGGCASPASMVKITMKDIPAPALNSNRQDYCGLDKPTIAELSNNTNAPASLVWYDAPVNGNRLTNATLLRDRTTYYGFDFSNTTGCLSYNAAEVAVSLSNCPPAKYANFFIPDGFSPNDDGVNDTYAIPDIEFLYPDYTLEIYNRYGNRMFKGNRDKPNWDGKNSDFKAIDGIAPNGIYFYVINFNKDNRSPLQGRLYLNR